MPGEWTRPGDTGADGVGVDLRGLAPSTTGWRRPAQAIPLAGTPDEMAEGLLAFGREGISHLQLVLLPTTPAGIAAFAPVMELLDRSVR